MGADIQWDPYGQLYRVNDLSLSRAVGDRFAKPVVSSEAEIDCLPIVDGKDEFFVRWTVVFRICFKLCKFHCLTFVFSRHSEGFGFGWPLGCHDQPRGEFHVVVANCVYFTITCLTLRLVA